MTVLARKNRAGCSYPLARKQGSSSGQRETEIEFEEDNVGQMVEMAIHNNDHSVISYSCGERAETLSK